VKNLLVRLLGFPATMLHGDTLVLDRWLWLRRRLPQRPSNPMRLLDVGCGSGGFTIGAALAGYQALGLSWDTRNQAVAAERASICNAALASFRVADIRRLEDLPDLREQFDVVICLETIEHILDDRKLLSAISGTLKKGGRLFLTTPSAAYRPITKGDLGPWSKIEDGGHVRKGYTAEVLQSLCKSSGLSVTRFSTCSGFASQKITAVLRLMAGIHPMLGWIAILPLRVLPPIVDPLIARLTDWPNFSLCLEAVKAARGAPFVGTVASRV
jgi:SAM-dependent methyltransferase